MADVQVPTELRTDPTAAETTEHENRILEATGMSPTDIEDLRQEVVGGLLYTHHRANANTSRILEVASFAYAVIELLKEKGLLTDEELNDRKRAVGKRLLEHYVGKNMGVMLQEGELDKYQFKSDVKIDCENRVHLCMAACCKLQFALSRQDIQEGIVKWDLQHPYMNAQSKEGYCVHLQQGSCRCSIYAHRPIPCRAYDCRNDKRIWADFEKKIPSPDLEKLLSGSPSSTGQQVDTLSISSADAPQPHGDASVSQDNALPNVG